MNVQPEPSLTPREYLAWERRQETRHEYVDGEVCAMTGASREHNLLSLNIAVSLHAQLRGKPCEVYTNDRPPDPVTKNQQDTSATRRLS